MPPANNDSKLAWTAIGILLLIPVVQFGFSRAFDNNWGLSHWHYLPWWLGLVWAGVVTGVGVCLLQASKTSQAKFSSRALAVFLSAVVLVSVIVFRFDSFLFGAGNIRVAEIAQRDYLLVRWFEYGSFYAVHSLFKLLSFLSIDQNTAGVWSWRGISFIAALVSLIGSAKIVGLLSRDNGRKVVLFIVLFFGPHLLPLLGFVGYSAVVVAVTVWFSYFALRVLRRGSLLSLFSMWMVLLAGVFLHASLAYLIPAALFATLRSLLRGTKGVRVGSVVAGLTFAAMVVALYLLAASRLEWLVEILLIKGKNPFSDYGLFSIRHLGDMLQILIGYVPQMILAIVLGLSIKKATKSDGSMILAALLAISGFTVVFIVDPSNGIAMDMPILVAYLYGCSLLVMLLCERLWSQSEGTRFSPAVVAALIVGAFLSYAPTYVRIANADSYLTHYFDQHKEYYSTACFAFRDAYFYKGDLEKANAWEQSVRYRSDYHINIGGISNLIQSDDNNEALRTLRWVRSEFPFRVEPQRLTATAQLNLNRPALAKPHLDTCFMLQPYAYENFRSLYIYYRDQQEYSDAVLTLKRALSIFDEDLEFTVDLLISHYRMADYITADSLCNVVLDKDPNQPYPYLIRGLIAELGNLPGMAALNYRQFMALAPNEPEAEFVRNRLDSLAAYKSP